MGPKAKGMKFTMAVSPLDCMGCTNCVKVCPKGALEMVPTEQEMDQQPVWDYMVENVSEKKELIAANVKGSQFKHRLLLHLGQPRCHRSLLQGQGRSRPGVEQLPVRGQCRARSGHGRWL